MTPAFEKANIDSSAADGSSASRKRKCIPSTSQLGSDLESTHAVEEDPFSLQTDRVERENNAEESKEEGPCPIEDSPLQTRSQSESSSNNDEHLELSMSTEPDKDKASGSEDTVQRWMGRLVSAEDPFVPHMPFDEHWESLQSGLFLIFRFCRVLRCSWKDLSDAQRDWFTTWIPEGQAQLNMSKGDGLIWVDATPRFLWEQAPLDR